MNIQEKLELISRNTAEIVERDELAKLLEEKKSPVIYHGFEPSGTGFHIGYIIGINKHIDFQKAGLHLKLLFADLHAWLNEKGSLEKIRKIAEIYKEGLSALGVDLKKADTVLGSSFQLKPEFFTDMLRLALRTRLLRVKRSMTIIGREEEDPHIAQLIYPLMQTIDIKALGVDIAFGDLAQRKIHMIARENLPALDYKCPIAIHHVDILGLTGSKMSSSIPKSNIMIDEEPDNIRAKILDAFCPAGQVEDNPILQIVKYIVFGRVKGGVLKIERDRKYGGDIIFESYKELEKAYGGSALHPQDLKKSVAEALIEILEPVRKHFKKQKIIKLKEEIG